MGTTNVPSSLSATSAGPMISVPPTISDGRPSTTRVAVPSLMAVMAALGPPTASPSGVVTASVPPSPDSMT